MVPTMWRVSTVMKRRLRIIVPADPERKIVNEKMMSGLRRKNVQAPRPMENYIVCTRKNVLQKTVEGNASRILRHVPAGRSIVRKIRKLHQAGLRSSVLNPIRLLILLRKLPVIFNVAAVDM